MNDSLVRPYAPPDWTAIAPLVEAWPFKPFARHSRWNASDLFSFTSARIRKTLENENNASCVVLGETQARGFASFTVLPWDSEQIGVPAARIDYLVAEGSYAQQYQTKKKLLDHVIVAADERGVRHLSVRVDASDLSSLHLFEQEDFITVDSILTLAVDLAAHRPVPPPDDFKIRLATADDAECVAALARTVFVYDRFHADPFISSERAGELHATWLHNSCTGKAADAVVLAEDHTGLLGFMTCALQRDTRKLGRIVGTVVMVASAEHARGRGVAHATLMAAIEWFREQRCEIVDTGTQGRNIPCVRLLQKCGFRLAGSSISLRRLL
jgi:dTDP-4-amino-4,6-dideoxy-D-galactose acyltransferase